MPEATDPLDVRPFRLSDAETVAPWLQGPGLSLPSGSWRQQWPERLLRDARIVALVASTPAGPVGLVRLDCGPDGIAEVTLVVAPGHRRCGQGRRMFAAALDHARRVGMRRLVAWVDIGNHAATDFFGDQGFESRGISGSRIRLERLVHAGGHLPPIDVGV